MGGWIGAGSCSTVVDGPAVVTGTGAVSAELCSRSPGVVALAEDVGASPPTAAAGAPS